MSRNWVFSCNFSAAGGCGGTSQVSLSALEGKSGQTNTSFRLLSDALGYRHPLFTCRATGSTFLSPFRESYVSLLSDYIPHSRLTLSPHSSRLHVRARTCSELPIALPSPLPLPSKRGEDSSSFLSLWRRSFGVPFFSLALPFAAGGGDNTCHGGRGSGSVGRGRTWRRRNSSLLSPRAEQELLPHFPPLLSDGGVGGPVGNIGQK